jgi:hypothetical protein
MSPPSLLSQDYNEGPTPGGAWHTYQVAFMLSVPDEDKHSLLGGRRKVGTPYCFILKTAGLRPKVPSRRVCGS